MKNFYIIGNGISLDVEHNSKLTTEFVATTFNESAVFAGSYSYPIIFPFTDKNVAFFEHSHHLENRSNRRAREVIISFFGMPWKEAILECQISRVGYEGTLKVDNGAIAEWMRDVTLSGAFSSYEDGKIIHQSIELGNDEFAVQNNILNNRNPILGYVWPTYINSYATGILKSGDDTLINDFDNMSTLSVSKLYSPWFYHVWLIRKLCEWMGYKAVGSYLDDQFIRSLIVYNTGMRTGADWKVQKKINPAEHLPNMTIADYFKSIRNDHRVMIYFDSLTKTAHFELSSHLLESDSILDITEGIHYDSLLIKGQNDTSFKLLSKVDDNDELYKNVSYEKSVMVGYDFKKFKELPLAIGRLYMAEGITIKSISNSILPITQQLGNIYSDSYNSDDYETVYNAGNEISKNSFSFRLASYKGLQTLGISSHRLPYATSNEKGNGGVVYSNSLDQGGARGLINQYTLQYYRFYCSSELVEVNVQMSVVDFFNLHPLQKVYIKDRNSAKVEVLMDKIVFEPQSNHTLLGRLNCYPNYDLLGSAQGMKVMVGSAVIENTEGVAYAKLFSKLDRVIPHPTLADKVLQFYKLTLEFYADAAGIVPYSVTNMPYKIIFNKYVLEWTRESGYYWYYDGFGREESGVANGSTYLHGEYTPMGNTEYQERPSLEENGQDLTVLGNYIWNSNTWNPI